MAKVIFGDHSSVLVPRQDRDSIRKGAGKGPNVEKKKEELRRMAP
jgi:hypothetical protein